MEVATTNNQSHHHHHHQHHNRHQQQQQQQLGNGVGGGSSTGSSILTGSGTRSPFQREVREWQRIDPDTGALLSGRLEADRWINGPLHSYGKISDSQNISQPNGTQHTQRKQFEVLKARTANGAMQVIRTQTVQKSSSRWSTTNTTLSTTSMPVTLPLPLTLSNANHWSQLAPSATAAAAVAAAKTKAKSNTKATTQMSNAVDICEVSDNDQHVVDDDVNIVVSDEVHNDDHIVVAVGSELATLIAADVVEQCDDNDNYGNNSNGHNNNNSNYPVINGSNSSFHKLGHNLLLDTAPSLKLSNLMKSSSSISSNSSINSNTATAATTAATATAATTMNTHRNAAKVSLHAIVGHNTKTASSATNTTTATQEDRTATGTGTATTAMPSASAASSTATITTAALATPWHKRLSEQPDLYGNSNNKHSQPSRVGVNASFGSSSGSSSGAGDAALAAVESCTTAAVRQTPPTQLNRQTRRDLESFRHYNEHAKSSTSRNFADDDVDVVVDVAAVVAADADANDDDDDLRLSARHQRRQQVPQQAPIPLQRTRSISTEDLSNDWERNELGQHTDDEPGEWRRVSKLRRSFQSQIKAAHNDYKPLSASAAAGAAASPSTSAGTRRPFDLPSNSVSVSRIRAELENGRRLNTAMRNNHVDLAALDTLLNTPPPAQLEKQTNFAKRTTFLTAESLKEIRGKLKKLSDESLYKEDFLAHQALRATPDYAAEHIEVQLVKPLAAAGTRSPTPTRSAFQPVRANAHARTPSTYGSVTQASHKTHSLESRQKYRDTSSSEWHLRRKSYGFEKMSPPEDRAIFRVDASTDSGLGRSGEQLGNWSPTETAPTGTRGTIIHFGEPLRKTNYQRREPAVAELSCSAATNELNKRHSIAVEESQYMRKSTQVRLNGGVGAAALTTGLETAEAVATRSQHKRVEFCKTEVHFAAESGRVNIVETDGKPPPTNNFRRRRRTSSGPLQSLVSAATTSASSGAVAMPITHFGDMQRHKTIATSTVAYKAPLMEANNEPQEATAATQVTVSTLQPLDGGYSLTESLSRSSYTSTSGIDTTDNETDDISAIRGILKNKPIKPKPYHLGENFESADVLWGVHLKSYNAERAMAMPKEDSPVSTKSVAERVRIVEKRQVDTELNNYSTKINLSLGDKDWPEPGPAQGRRASAQELLLQDLREHQRMLDEGLKSTSLIIKTMRSASAFDAAMRRLSIASVESACLPPTIVVPTPMLRSHSYQESLSSTSSRRSSSYAPSITSSDLFGDTLDDTLPRSYAGDGCAPQAPPRLKLLGNAAVTVSQQLTQLRRMYDAAQDEADSADEEVKSYFTHGLKQESDEFSDSGGGTQDTDTSLEDVRSASEYSSSWSRLKAKRTIWQIEADAQQQQQQLQQHALEQQTFRRADLPKSNVMSIALHSPKAEQAEAKPTLRVAQLTPVAKPRTTLSTAAPSLATTQTEVHTAATVKQQQTTLELTASNAEALKIVKEARGARKLREHELSYFGVPVSNGGTTKAASPKLNGFASSRRSLPSRKLSREDAKPSAAANQTTTKWQLLNDRPDLLRHSPTTVEPQLKANDIDEDFDEHFYQNIAHELKPSFRVKSPSPHSYDRKTDVQRDVQILSEMTRNADQTLKAISDEAALKDQRRRSTLQRRNSKPLETIDEKSFTSDKASSPSVARGTFASEARRNSLRSTPSPTQGRSSSQSSIECCPRARSRSLSSDGEYENVKPRRSATHKSKTAATTTTTTTSNSRRSSSLESATQCSSGDERHVRKREERVRTRTPKRVSSSANHTQTREKQRLSSHSVEKRQAAREETLGKPRASSMRERKSTHQHERTHSSSRRHKGGDESTGQHSEQRTSRGNGSGSSNARVRSHSTDRHEKHGSSRLLRSTRAHENDVTSATKHRLERTDREKDKLTRSRGHSNRSSHNERERERKPMSATTPTTTTRNTSSSTQRHSEHKKPTATATATKSNNSTSAKHGTKISAQQHQHHQHQHHHHHQQQQQQVLNENELTHGKNAKLMNGQAHNGQQHYTQQQHIQHSLTTTTIAGKQRDRHGKDRK